MKLLMLVAALLAGAIMQSAAPDPGRLIVGSWKHTMTQLNCSEVYTYRADGTSHVTSGQEVGDSTYEISPTPTPGGFYKLVDTVTADNGGKDCTGNITPIGDKSTSYIRFSRDGNSMIECYSDSGASCFGPLKRQPD